jgi:hypothetical protein
MTNNEDIVNEVRDIFVKQAIPLAPWGLIQVSHGVYELVDKDGCCIYQLTVPDQGSINSAERAGARDIIGNSAYFLKVLLDEYDRFFELIIDLKDTITDAKETLERSE